MSEFVWPFRTKLGDGTPANIGNSTTQWRRIDQGQDLQGITDTEEECLAVASGTTSNRCDPGSNGGHFGCPYIVLFLDKPVDGVTAIYYGHAKPAVPEGTHVNQGDVVAHTTSPGGGGAPDHWLEIGPWVSQPTGNGQWMHNQLLTAPIFGAQPPEVFDVDNLVLVTPESGQGPSYLWNTATNTKHGIADQPTAQSFKDAGGKTFVMNDAEIAAIPNG